MTGKKIENIVTIICLAGWVPILAIFSGLQRLYQRLREIILVGMV